MLFSTYLRQNIDRHHKASRSFASTGNFTVSSSLPPCGIKMLLEPCGDEAWSAQPAMLAFTTITKDPYVLVHVDDFQIFPLHQRLIDHCRHDKAKTYKMFTVNTNVFMVISMTSTSTGTMLSHSCYASEKLNSHELIDCKPARQPLAEILAPITEESFCKERYPQFNHMTATSIPLQQCAVR